MEKFVIDIGLDAEELPNLPILERDLQNVIVSLVGERLDFGIEDFNGRYVQRRHKVRTILHLLFAFPAEHHKCENLGVLYTEQMYGIASILIYRGSSSFVQPNQNHRMRGNDYSHRLA